MEKVQLENSDFEGLNNVYILQREAGTTLVDVGMNTGEMYEQLTAGLRAAGTSVDRVDRILLTHWHPDHVGLASRVVDDSGATVHIHEADAPLVEGNAWDLLRPRYERRFEEWGMPPAKRERLAERFRLEDEELSGETLDVETFVGGDRFDVGEYAFEVVHLPGHTAGLSGFAFEGPEGPELLSGDALLPVYTPNVGGADIRVEHALQRYLDTLVTIAAGDYVRAHPGHREPIEDPTARAVEIVEHHRDRTDRIVDVLAEVGTADAWTVGHHLFGELDDIHILHGPGEASAHLEHLTAAGVAEKTPEGYRLTDADVDLDDLFPAMDAAALERVR